MVRFNFAARLTLYSVALIALSVAVTSVVVYHFKISALTASLGKELLGIVNTAAVAIDGDQHERIQFDATGELQGDDDFAAIQRQLLAVKQANGLTSHGSPIYTVRRTDGPATNRVVEFVVLTDPDENGEIPAGNLYEAPPHLLTALAGQAAASGVYADPHGEWISAAAPIRDRQGRVVAAVQADRTAAYFAAEARDAVLAVLLAALGSVAVASFMAWWFARDLVKPLRRLVETARQIGQGNFDFKAGLDRVDEIGDLSRGFDEASRRLAESRQRDQALTAELQSTNRRLEQAVQSATELARAAQAADSAKSEFLAAMSHELRTPLNHVIGLGELVLDSTLDDEQRENVTLMRNSGNELLRLVESVLDFGIMESRRLRLAGAHFDLRACVAAVADEVRPKAGDNPIQFTVEVADDAPREMFGDAKRLRQVLVNLLENSVKFTERGAVTLRVTPAMTPVGRTGLRFSVQDTGPGITPEQRPRLFQPFTQLDGSITRRHGGIGLGLVLSQRLVQLMGGEITVQSEPGQGSTFAFVIESAPPPASALAA
jgi:signal transduction histidine kinase